MNKCIFIKIASVSYFETEVIYLYRRRTEKVFRQCYPGGKSAALRIAGFVLIGIGLILLLFCVPWWAWAALFGFVLIAAGILLAMK